jgi:hypothetical protein
MERLATAQHLQESHGSTLPIEATEQHRTTLFSLDPHQQDRLSRVALPGRGALRLRRDAGSPLRQFEKRAAGVPIRDGSDSPLQHELPVSRP